MTTWADLRSKIRVDLKDNSGTPRWDDEQLHLWLSDAVNDYSLYFPILKTRVQLTLSVDKYPLPADYIKAVFVECPADRYLEERRGRPGVHFPTTGQPTRYQIIGADLYLNGSPLDGAQVLLTYDAIHPLPANAADDAFVITVPPIDEEVIRLYVKAKAFEQVRSKQANLDRFQPGSGRRDDNPLKPEVNLLMEDYRRKMAERDGGGVVQLWRPGRTR